MSLWVLKTRSLRGYLQTQIAAWGFVGAWVHLVLTRAAAGLEGALGASATRPTRGGKDSRATGRARFSLCLDPGHAEEESAIRRAILPEERSAGAQEHRGGAQLLAEKAGHSSSPSWGLRGEVSDPHSSLGCIRRCPFSWAHPSSGVSGDTFVPPPASKVQGCLWGQATGQGADPQRVAVPAVQGTLPAAGRAQSAPAPAAAPCEGSACRCL